LFDFLQTLLELNIANNYIGDEGVQYLSEALKQNEVKYFFYSFVTIKVDLYTIETNTIGYFE